MFIGRSEIAVFCADAIFRVFIGPVFVQDEEELGVAFACIWGLFGGIFQAEFWIADASIIGIGGISVVGVANAFAFGNDAVIWAFASVVFGHESAFGVALAGAVFDDEIFFFADTGAVLVCFEPLGVIAFASGVAVICESLCGIAYAFVVDSDPAFIDIA